jgi:hypothetical protein
MYWLNCHKLETDQHHIIMPHRFCDLSNLVLEEYKQDNYCGFLYGAWQPFLR